MKHLLHCLGTRSRVDHVLSICGQDCPHYILRVPADILQIKLSRSRKKVSTD